jgi:hypothetical protein
LSSLLLSLLSLLLSLLLFGWANDMNDATSGGW